MKVGEVYKMVGQGATFKVLKVVEENTVTAYEGTKQVDEIQPKFITVKWIVDDKDQESFESFVKIGEVEVAE